MKKIYLFAFIGLFLASCAKDRPKNIALNYNTLKLGLTQKTGVKHLPTVESEVLSDFQANLQNQLERGRCNVVESTSGSDLIVNIEGVQFREEIFYDECDGETFELSRITLEGQYSLLQPNSEIMTRHIFYRQFVEEVYDHCPETGAMCVVSCVSYDELVKRVAKDIRKEVRNFRLQ